MGEVLSEAFGKSGKPLTLKESGEANPREAQARGLWVKPTLERLSLKEALTARTRPGDDGPGFGS